MKKPNIFVRIARTIKSFFIDLFKSISNFFFCLKYPFWRSRNVWTGKYSKSYRYTWYDDIEIGWRKAFGKQLSDDIKAAFKEDKKENPKLKWKDALYWEQIKEKWGKLCLYHIASSHISEVLQHYEDISGKYCYQCGKPARYISKGYILPFCNDCFEARFKDIRKEMAQAKNKPDNALTKEWISYKKERSIPRKKIAPENVQRLYK